MEIAWHIGSFAEPRKPEHLGTRLRRIYAWAGDTGADFSFLLPEEPWRIYIGDEFCPNRLPSVRHIQKLMNWCQTEGYGLTLLTPCLSDAGMGHCVPVLDQLAACNPCAEVVANDWGMVLFLKERYPSLHIALGRLLNKSFKDPRLGGSAAEGEREKGHDLFGSCSFDFAGFRRKAAELGVERLERDLPPYAFPTFNDDPLLKESYTFPFGYVTSGRVCWSAALANSPDKRFAISERCSRPCENFAIRLKNPAFHFPLLHAGNTVYYLYPLEICAALLEKARAEGVRLVFDDSALRMP